MAEAPRNDVEIWIIPLDWFKESDENVKKRLNTDILSLVQFGQSAQKVSRQVKLLGMIGRAYIKIASDGKKYVIFKGLAGARPNLTGTRYLAENPKVACFVIGAEDILKDATKGTRVAVIAYVAIDILKECTMDHFSLARLGVNLSSDILQAVIATGAGVAAGAIVGAFFVGAAPVVLVFAIVVGVSFAAGIGGIAPSKSGFMTWYCLPATMVNSVAKGTAMPLSSMKFSQPAKPSRTASRFIR